MTDKETAAWIRQWVQNAPHDIFSWPTDECGYEQHIRFVGWRNEQWQPWCEYQEVPGHLADFDAFVLEYADRLERGTIPRTAHGQRGRT